MTPLTPSSAPADTPFPPLSSPVDGLMVSAVDPSTDTAHLVYVSEGLAAAVGRPVLGLLGQAPDVLFADDTPPAQLDAVAEMVAGGKQAVLTMALQKDDGSSVPVHANFLAVPSLSDGWPVYIALFRLVHEPDVEDASPAMDHTRLFDALAHLGSLDEVIVHLAERTEPFLEGGRVVMALAYAHEPTSDRFDLVRTAGFKPGLLADFFATVSRSSGLRHAQWINAAALPLEMALDFQNAGIASLWLTPMLRNDDEVLGVVVVAHKVGSEPDAGERQLLAAVARLAAVAMDRSRREADLALRALHDPLTGLPNRDLMTDRLSQLIDLSKRPSLHTRFDETDQVLAVVLVDLDRFKSVNDRRGSMVGDTVLAQTAQRLRSVLRVGDTMGRVGSDQFLIACPGRRDEAEAFAIADELREAVISPIEIDEDEPVSMTASVGLVLVHVDDTVDAADVISSAESAVDAAHDAGRDQVSVFDSELRRQLSARHEMEAALAEAIAADELFLLYQPIIEVSSGSMIGAEALIRWNRPGHGVLTPVLFIDIAEDSGLIIDIGNWVIREVCRQIAEWPGRLAGGEPVISVNLSARQLSHSSLMPTVAEALDYYGVIPSCLGLEVTESMKVEDLERASSALVGLAELGCHLSIDDFGIGYATLDYLRRFSMAHTLKIDRSFVDGLGRSREDTAIVSASVTLARSLGLTVVAEGVETVEQLEHLHDLGADYAQGYLLSKPVELDDAHLLWHRATLIPGGAF